MWVSGYTEFNVFKRYWICLFFLRFHVILHLKVVIIFEAVWKYFLDNYVGKLFHPSIRSLVLEKRNFTGCLLNDFYFEFLMLVSRKPLLGFQKSNLKLFRIWKRSAALYLKKISKLKQIAYIIQSLSLHSRHTLNIWLQIIVSCFNVQVAKFYPKTSAQIRWIWLETLSGEYSGKSGTLIKCNFF